MEIKPWSEFDTIDFSGIDQYLGCAEQWRRVALGERRPPAIALVEGSITHDTLAKNNHNKKSKGKDLAPKKLVDLHMASVEEVKNKQDKELDWENETPDTLFSRAKVWYPEYVTKSKMLRPDIIEQPMIKEVEVEGVKFNLSGIIDLTDEKTVHDYKTCSSIKSQNETDASLQLSIYSYFMNLRSVSFWCFVKTKNPYVAQVKSRRSPNDWAWALKVAKSVMESIRHGCFPLANPDPRNWRCSEKFCGFWSTCRGKYVQLPKVQNEKGK